MSPPNSQLLDQYARPHLNFTCDRGFITSFLVGVAFSFVYRDSSCHQDGRNPTRVSHFGERSQRRRRVC